MARRGIWNLEGLSRYLESAQLPKSGGEARNLESGWSEPRSWKMPLANPGALRKLGNSETVFCSSRQPEGGRCGNSETRKLFFAQKNAGPSSPVCNGLRVLPTARCLRRSGSDGSCRPCARALIRARGSTLTLLLDTNSGAWYYNNLTTRASRDGWMMACQVPVPTSTWLQLLLAMSQANATQPRLATQSRGSEAIDDALGALRCSRRCERCSAPRTAQRLAQVCRAYP